MTKRATRVIHGLVMVAAPATMLLAGCEKESTATPDEAVEADAAPADEDDGELPPIDEGVAGVSEAEPEAILSPASFENGVNDHMQEVVDCYVEAHGKNSKLAGTMQAKFTISAEGKVESVEAGEGSSLSDDGLTKCIEDKAKNWAFDPTPSGESTPMEFPFNLSPG